MAQELKAVGLVGKALSTLGNSNRFEIAKFLNEEKKASFAEIKTKFNFNDNTIRFHVKKLIDANLVEQPRKRGNYKLTELGADTFLLVMQLQEYLGSQKRLTSFGNE